MDNHILVSPRAPKWQELALLSRLLQRFGDVFSLSGRKPGRYTFIKHHIRTVDHHQQCTYSVLPEEGAVMKRQVNSLLADGMVEESS